MSKRSIVSVLAFCAFGCNEGNERSDAGMDGGGMDVPASDVQVAQDVPVDSDVGVEHEVTLFCHEVEIGVNASGSTLRWYGSVMSDAAPLTEALVDRVAYVGAGRSSGAVIVGQRMRSTPFGQHVAMFEFISSEEENGLCDDGGKLTRSFRDEPLVIEVSGTSAEGTWRGECMLPPERVFVTCHRGESLTASGYAANNDANPLAGEPEAYGELILTVYSRLELPDDWSVVELWVESEGGELRRDLPLDGAEASTLFFDMGAMVRWSGDWFDDDVCPPVDGAIPPELIAGYRLATSAGEVSGVAPLGNCQTL